MNTTQPPFLDVWPKKTTDDLWKRWPSFTPGEFRCKGSGDLAMNPEFMDRLQAVRFAFNRPMIVTSGFRSPGYNKLVSGTGASGPHTTGRAVDILVMGGDALALIGFALQHGMTGIGVSQKTGSPADSRFIHLDDLEGPRYPRPSLWSY